jgi:uncharacterized protein (AIM24 family)
MNCIVTMLKNLLSLLAGAAGAAALIVCVQSFVEWQKGPASAERKVFLEEQCQILSKKISTLEKKILQHDQKIETINKSNSYDIVKKARAARETALKTAAEFQLLKTRMELSKVQKELSIGLAECLKKNIPAFYCYTVEFFLFLLLCPLIVSALLYYVLARFIDGFSPIIAASAADPQKEISVSGSDVSIDIKLSGSEHLYIRGGWCKKKTDVDARTRLMWHWSAPLVSFAADLFELVDFSAVNGGEGKISITAPTEDLFISRVDLGEGRAIVIRPRHLVGVTDGIRIRTYWNFSLHNILSGKIRQIILYGEGFILVSGSWGIEGTSVTNSSSKIESHLLIGYDAHARYSLCRTETFWHYFRKEAALFDVKLQSGTFITQNNSWSYMNKNASFIEKAFTAFFNGLGSILGF